MSIHSTRKSKSQKNGPSGAVGPASASPWRAKEKKNYKKISHNAEKTEKGVPLGFFSIYSVAKLQKKLKGGPFGKKIFYPKKVAVPKKKLKGGLARYGMLRGKTGKTFLFQFARPNSAIWCNNIL